MPSLSIENQEMKDGIFFTVELKTSGDGVNLTIGVPESCEDLAELLIAMPFIEEEIHKAIDRAHTLYHAKNSIPDDLEGLL